MPVSPYSRYRGLAPVDVPHATRGPTRSLPVRRDPAPAAGALAHLLRAHETVDELALRYYGREDLYWWILDANGGRTPADLAPGERLAVPPLSLATRVVRPG